ncbi:hypothetical protein MBLNU459_g8327t2 [Dothideomycetes sp. NU459]
MAVTLGKRKRRAEVAQAAPANAKPKLEEDPESDNEDLQAIFRRAFEAKFKPLDGLKKKRNEEAVKVLEQEEDDESDWSGISEPEDHDAVEVVEHKAIERSMDRADKQQIKAFMSSKPPSSDTKLSTTSIKRQSSPTEDDGTDAANLKNDLALQRLLNESHLLDSSFSSTDPSGKNRHKATELRLQSLGSKGSILEQKNMPMSHRKGINAKVKSREEERRRDAKENGIILERAVGKTTSKTSQRRERGVGGPNVGKFSGGTLRLSKADFLGADLMDQYLQSGFSHGRLWEALVGGPSMAGQMIANVTLQSAPQVKIKQICSGLTSVHRIIFHDSQTSARDDWRAASGALTHSLNPTE